MAFGKMTRKCRLPGLPRTMQYDYTEGGERLLDHGEGEARYPQRIASLHPVTYLQTHNFSAN